MPTLSDEELATCRAACARRDAAEQARQRARRAEGRAAAHCVAERLRADFGAERVILFGSLARDERLGPRSDLDLVVWGLSADAYYRAVARTQRVAGDWAVDLVRWADAPSSLRTRIKTEGIEL